MLRLIKARVIPRKSVSKWLVVVAIGVAAFSRLYALDVLPPQVWFDEIWFALKARQSLQTGSIPVFYKTYWGGVHPLMVILTAVVQALGFDSPISPRVISSLSGILAIPLAYLCFNELWHDTQLPQAPPTIPVVTVLILSNLTSYVVLSRVGLEWSLAAVLTLGCVWLFHYARRTGRLVAWILN